MQENVLEKVLRQKGVGSERERVTEEGVPFSKVGSPLCLACLARLRGSMVQSRASHPEL